MDTMKKTNAETNSAKSHKAYLDSEYDSVIQECLKHIYTTPDDHQAVEKVLRCLGTHFECDRVTLFLARNEYWISAEFEWLSPSAVSLKDRIQNEALEYFSWNNDFFASGEAVLMRDLERIRSSCPSAYALLKSRHVTSAACLSILVENRFAGVISMENMSPSRVIPAKDVLSEINSYMKPLVKRLNMLRQFEAMSFHDPLTGALNRNALTKLYDHPLMMKSVGIIFCDVSGLKSVNDTQGHKAGDEMLIQCCRLIQKTLHTSLVYRFGGDEFLALYHDEPKELVEKDLEQMRRRVATNKYHIAVGCAWSDKAPLMLEPLISIADKEMYADKQKYYSTRDSFARNSVDSQNEYQIVSETRSSSAFQYYLDHCYFDAETLMNSIMVNNLNQFFYFGDIRANCYYISDLMRDRFGFDSNILPDLPHFWEQCICDEEYKRMNNIEVELLFSEKRTSYELLHLLEDVYGNRFWAHNSGILQWNEDQTVPLFMSGRVTVQGNSYSTDQITGFQKEHKAVVKLAFLQHAKQKTDVIGFCLNNFDKINKGGSTYKGNMLLYHIGTRLLSKLGSKMTFYRLSDVDFMAILEPEFADQSLELMDTIRLIIEDEYTAAEIYFTHSAQFSILHYMYDSGTAQEFMELVNETIDMAKRTPNVPYVTLSDERKKKVEETEQMVSTLYKNIHNNMENFRIVIQPAVHAKTYLQAGEEALLRWRYEGRDIPLEDLLPLLEREGLLVGIDRWVIEQTICEGTRLKDCAKDYILTFNISHQVCQSKGFTDFLDQTLRRYGMDDHQFFAELYETHMLTHTESVTEFIKFCKKLGIQITQKGFGSLNSLFHVGMHSDTDVLKLGLSLLETMGTKEDQMKCLQSLVYLCHKFGKKLCVTEVENKEDNDMVVASGCDYIQGYYHHCPMELSELYDFLLN
ncbi:MAG: EAL domain-containing protein [Eubacteriales bacterium]|nr:EAL domain-containing protein [Eubacteriales bacterium]